VAHQPTGNLRQRQAAETRLQLLTAACEIFEERGFQGASVGAITERASTAHGTFYLYFKNKEDAFCCVMEVVIIDELAAAAQSPAEGPPRQVIEHVLRGFVSAYTPHVGLWRAVLEGALISPRVRQLWLELRHVFIDRVTAGLEAGQAVGTIRPLDPILAAHALAAMVEWFAFTHLELNTPPARESLDGAIMVLADLWYHAIFGEVPA
jgi:AcrR family transcriptional regulator